MLFENLLPNLRHRDPCFLTQFIHSHNLEKVLLLDSLEFDIRTIDRGINVRVPFIDMFDVSFAMLLVLSVVLFVVAPHLLEAGVRTDLFEGL